MSQKKTPLPNQTVTITTEIQTPDSEHVLSCLRDKLSRIYQMLKCKLRASRSQQIHMSKIYELLKARLFNN